MSADELKCTKEERTEERREGEYSERERERDGGGGEAAESVSVKTRG